MSANSHPHPANLESRIEALTAKGRRAQRTFDGPDWSVVPEKPFWLPRHTVALAISQFYHGEEATADLCETVAERIDGKPAQDFLATQVADERRHAGFYRRYATSFGGLTAPMPALSNAYATARDWTGPPEALILAIHVVLEGENLSLQKTVNSWMPCPLFADISHHVARDEARHRAFGDLYLRATLPQFPIRERLRFFRWIARHWAETVSSLSDGFAPPGFFRRRAGYAAWMRRAWMRRCDELEKSGLFTAAERPVFLAASDLGS